MKIKIGSSEMQVVVSDAVPNDTVLLVGPVHTDEKGRKYLKAKECGKIKLCKDKNDD